MANLADWYSSIGGLQDWAIYALAFVALGLLPVKTSKAWLADRGISFALALLWASTAFAAIDSHPGWSALAGLESILFLTVGVARLRFPARTGPWTFAGTILILYSLLVFPLLALFQVPFFESSALDSPFPLVLFTCGILFFSVDLAVDILLVLPLVWAFLGGPQKSPGPVELVELEIVLVAGALFLALPTDLRALSGNRSASVAAYRLSYRRRAVFGYGLWMLILGTIFLFLGARQSGVGPALQQTTRSLALLSALGVLLWLAYPAWQSLWYRYVAWGVARAGGHVRVWVREQWRWGLLLIAMVAVLWSLDPKLPSGLPPSTKLEAESPASLESVLGKIGDSLNNFLPHKQTLWAVASIGLLWLLLEAYQGRRRLVIGGFEDKTGESNAWVTGLGSQLQNELVRIADLYKVIDEALPSRKSDVVQVVPGVEDTGAILKEAISSTLGSTGFATQLAGLSTRLVSGPQLKGTLHKVGEDYVITANLSGAGLAFSWKVDTSTLSDEERKNPATKEMTRALLSQLAFRIATDLVAIGSPRWRAVRCFTEGLKQYRDTQRQNDKNHKLREAERCFIRALNDDLRFTQCHYNLGVAYRQLGELASAEAAFRRVLRDNPDHFEACYALAETLVHCSKFEEALRFCEAAVLIDPDDARAWDLWGYALRHREQRAIEAEVALNSGHSAWELIRERKEIAVALAWRSLCREALRGPSPMVQSEMTTALLCARNLAVVLTRIEEYRQSERVFQQAAWLAPHDPYVGVYEGRTCFWTKDWDRAKSRLGGVFDEGLDSVNRGLLWSTLAQAHSAASGPADLDPARLAHQRFLDLAAGASREDLDKLVSFSLEPPPQEQST